MMWVLLQKRQQFLDLKICRPIFLQLGDHIDRRLGANGQIHRFARVDQAVRINPIGENDDRRFSINIAEEVIKGHVESIVENGEPLGVGTLKRQLAGVENSGVKVEASVVLQVPG